MAQNAGNLKTPPADLQSQTDQEASKEVELPSLMIEDPEKTDPNLSVSTVEQEEPTQDDIQVPPKAAPTPKAPQPPKPQAKNVTPMPSRAAPPIPPAQAGPPPLQPSPPAAAPPQAVAPAVRMPEMGILNDFMKDPTISEIMVNDLRNIVVERSGKMYLAGVHFNSVDDLNRITRNILDITGRILSPDSPYVDTHLPDGSRVNIVSQPLNIRGPCLTIRKFPSTRYTANDLISQGTLDQRMAHFLRVCVFGKLNILICGGTGSGKTTLLNVLTSFIPKEERIICIEDTPELVVPHANSVCLQTKPQTPASAPVTMRELVANALRMRPDRILVGECRRSEAFDMLQAMNTGHAGSMTTIHANSPRDGLSRVETLCMLAGVEIPILAIRKQMVSALDLIVQIHRSRTGTRRITAISEVTGIEGDTITLQDIFVFEPGNIRTGNVDGGEFKVTGLVPTFVDTLRDHGIELPPHYFS